MLALLSRRTAPSVLSLLSSSRPLTTTAAVADLRDFLDSPGDPENVTFGRAWKASELRNKSWDDLHKLWYVCLKERNMCLTQYDWERKFYNSRSFPSQHRVDLYLKRYKMVKLTMNRIKQVLSQRACNESNAVKAADMKRVIHYM